MERFPVGDVSLRCIIEALWHERADRVSISSSTPRVGPVDPLTDHPEVPMKDRVCYRVVLDAWPGICSRKYRKSPLVRTGKPSRLLCAPSPIFGNTADLSAPAPGAIAALQAVTWRRMG